MNYKQLERLEYEKSTILLRNAHTYMDVQPVCNC